MAAGAGTVTVKFLGDLADLQKKTHDAGDTVGGFGDKMKQAAGGIAQAFAGLGVADYLKNATEAAAEDQAAHEKLVQSLHNSIGAFAGTTDAVEKWITKMQFAKGFSDNDLRTSFASLTDVTHNVADTQELLGTAMDIARAKGIPLADAADLLAKAHEGNTKAIKAQFPELAKLISDHASAQEVISAVTDTVKGQADTFAGTATGKTEIFHQKMNELTEAIGAHLLPIMAGLADWLNKIITWFSNLPGPVQTGIVVVAGIAAALVALNGALGVATAAAAAFGVSLNVSLGPIALVVAAIAGVGFAIYELVKHWDTVKAAAASVWQWIVDKWPLLLAVLTGPFGLAVLYITRNFSTIIDTFKGAWNAVANFLNGLQFTIHVPHIIGTPIGGDYTIGLPNLPRFHSGGVVPGAPGSDVMAILQAGERVLPAGAGSGNVYNITINGAVDKAGTARELEDLLYRFQQQGGTLRFV